MIQLTAAAVEHLQRQRDAHEGDNPYVRIRVSPGGCAGTKYDLAWTAARQDDDAAFPQPGGLTVLCDPFSLTSISGLRVDHVEAMVGGGLRFDNPLAGRTCGCGDSFAPAAGPEIEV